MEPLLGRRDSVLVWLVFLRHELLAAWLGGNAVMKTPLVRRLGLVTLAVLPSPARGL